jgi:hypothetical protein
MNHKDVLIDMLQHFGYVLHRTITDLPMDALQWQPDSEANNIAVTVWHVCRALDVLKVKIIENKPDQNQLWYHMGWASKTNYVPAGLGIGGFGNLSGYTLDQVKAVPVLAARCTCTCGTGAGRRDRRYGLHPTRPCSHVS